MSVGVPSASDRMDDLKLDENGAFRDFVSLLFKNFRKAQNDYMYAKAMKLLHQVNDNIGLNSKLFEGLAVYVNGYTEPPALHLRNIFVANGGSYHHYMRKSTNYIIASSIAIGKWKSVAQYTILHPNWIVESAQKNTLLPIEDYRLKPEDVSEAPEPSTSVEIFYEHSRLHLISTLSNEMKELVSNLRSTLGTRTFISRSKLLHLVEENFDEHKIEPVIVHIDMDCFFVSVALKTRQHFSGQPVKADTGGRAEIASCSYEARAYNIRNGMWVNEAVQRCPNLICLPYEFDKYRMMSNVFYSVIARYTVDIKAVSCDELYIDLMTLCRQMKITAVDEVVKIIRMEILNETGCNASAGIGPNMIVARLATRKAKPNGQFRVTKANVMNFVKDVPIKDLPGVGYSAMGKIQAALSGMKLCSDLRRISLSQLQSILGRANGKKIYNTVRGEAEGGLNLVDDIERKSVSCDVNFGVRLSTQNCLRNLLSDIAWNLSGKLMNLGLSASALTLKLLIRAKGAPIEPAKYGAHGECDQISKSAVLSSATNGAEAIFEQCRLLATDLNQIITDIRGVSVQATRIVKCGEGSFPQTGHRSREILKNFYDYPSSSLVPAVPLPTYSDREREPLFEESIDEELLLYLPPVITYETNVDSTLEKLLKINYRKMGKISTSRKIRRIIDELVITGDYRALRLHLQPFIHRSTMQYKEESLDRFSLFIRSFKMYVNFMCQLRHRMRMLPVKNLSVQF